MPKEKEAGGLCYLSSQWLGTPSSAPLHGSALRQREKQGRGPGQCAHYKASLPEAMGEGDARVPGSLAPLVTPRGRKVYV